MHTIDLSKYNYRTDLIVEELGEKSEIHKTEYDEITVEKLEITDKNKKDFSKKKGTYITISFKDITDKDNFKKLEKILINELKQLLKKFSITGKKILVVGLGNSKSTPDALGPKTIEQILVTSHLFEIGEVESGYENVSSFKPEVTGTTGIETKSLIDSLIKTINADLLVVIDALASLSINRVNKTIQITDSGIHPGSGVGNNRKELSSETLGIPVIAIGVPTIVDAATIVADTFNCILKQISYKLDNLDNNKLKLTVESRQDYSNHEATLTKETKEKLLGIVGTLDDEKLRQLFTEALSPIGYNLMVTPKEIDFSIDRLALLIGNSINKSIHQNFNTTK